LQLIDSKVMAVEAVLSEPLSRPDSLLSGINTGIFHGSCGKCPGIIRQSSRIQVISRAFLKIGPRLNREFNFNYQGIVIVYLGKLRPISELRNPSSRRMVRARTLDDLIKTSGLTRSYVKNAFRCVALSPPQIDAILSGRHRVDLTVMNLTNEIPFDWNKQQL
jgi:hypothetical protein